jgi:hypothetical protein
VLAEARKLHFGLTLAHQHLGQLTPEVKKAVLANARSRVIFQTSATEAGALARELAPDLTPQDLMGLGAYEVAVSLSTGTRVAPPVTGCDVPGAAATRHGSARPGAVAGAVRPGSERGGGSDCRAAPGPP